MPGLVVAENERDVEHALAANHTDLDRRAIPHRRNHRDHAAYWEIGVIGRLARHVKFVAEDEIVRLEMRLQPREDRGWQGVQELVPGLVVAWHRRSPGRESTCHSQPTK